MYNSEQNGAKIFDLGQNRNFLWIFKVAENRDSKTHYQAAEIAEKEWVEGSSWRKTRTSIAWSELRVLWLRSTLVRAETMPERCVVFGCNKMDWFCEIKTCSLGTHREFGDVLWALHRSRKTTPTDLLIIWFGGWREMKSAFVFFWASMLVVFEPPSCRSGLQVNLKVSEANERWDISQHQSVCPWYFVH